MIEYNRRYIFARRNDEEIEKFIQHQCKQNCFDTYIYDSIASINSTIKKIKKRETMLIDIQIAFNIIEQFNLEVM